MRNNIYVALMFAALLPFMTGSAVAGGERDSMRPVVETDVETTPELVSFSSDVSEAIEVAETTQPAAGDASFAKLLAENSPYRLTGTAFNAADPPPPWHGELSFYVNENGGNLRVRITRSDKYRWASNISVDPDAQTIYFLEKGKSRDLNYSLTVNQHGVLTGWLQGPTSDPNDDPDEVFYDKLVVRSVQDG